MKHIYFFVLVFTMFTNTLFADTDDAIENLVAITSAPSKCGFVLNKSMVNISVSTLFTNPSDLNRNGRHWGKVQDTMERIKKLTSTEEGRKSYCSRVSRDLSAFFDSPKYGENSVSSDSLYSVLKVQRLLTEKGYAPGPVDGLMGSKTESAILQFKTDKGLPANSEITDIFLNQLSQ